MCALSKLSGKVNKCCYIHFTGLYLWNFGVEVLSYLSRCIKNMSMAEQTLIQIFLNPDHWSLWLLVSKFSFIPGGVIFLRRKLSVFIGCVRKVTYQIILKINPKCLPVTYYPPYGLTDLLSICLRKKTPICSFLRYLQSLPHAAYSAWTTSMKSFYCPITVYPYKHRPHFCITSKDENFFSYKHSKK